MTTHKKTTVVGHCSCCRFFVCRLGVGWGSSLAIDNARFFLVLAIALLACGVICGTGPEALLNPRHD